MKIKLLDKLRGFFQYAYVAVVLEERSCDICVKILKQGKVAKEERKSFRAFGSELPFEASTLIRKYFKEYRFCYVSTLLGSINQGALGTTVKADFQKYHVDAASTQIIGVQDKWSIYGYAEDISWARNAFEAAGGVDFIFSPFAMLFELSQESQEEKPKLFVLSQKSSLTLAVMDHEKLHYGGYYILAPTEGIKDGESDDLGDDDLGGDDLSDDIEDLSEIDGIDDIDGIGDLDDLDDDVKLDDFEEDIEADSLSGMKTDREKLSQTNESLEELGKGMDMLNFIKDSLNSYYKDEIYQGQFIEDIVLLDSSGMSQDVADYIETTLLLNVERIEVSLADKMCDITIKEVTG